MRYKNIKTGIEIVTPCPISSPDYEEITPKAPAVKLEPKVKAEKPVESVTPKKPEKAKTLKRVKK